MIRSLKHSLLIWLIKKVQRYGPHRVEVLGSTYEISENVFNPRYYYTSKFMAAHISLAPGDEVLDIGTGSGIQAITAARQGCRVTAVDINPEAVHYARRNVVANGLADSIMIKEGDLFAPLGKDERFDVVFFTPPYFDGIPANMFERALIDTDKGLIRRFFSEAGNFMKPGGYVQMVYSSVAGHEEVLNMARELGWENSLIAESRTWTEIFMIYRLRQEGRE